MTPFVGPPEPESPIQAHLSRQAAQEKKDRGLGVGWKVGPAAASLFDAWTTQDALKRGGEEANPLMKPLAGNNAALYGVNVGAGILTGIIADKLAKSGHRNAARLVSGLSMGVHTAAGASNLASGRDD
jgi:hypothetical protein